MAGKVDAQMAGDLLAGTGVGMTGAVAAMEGAVGHQAVAGDRSQGAQMEVEGSGGMGAVGEEALVGAGALVVALKRAAEEERTSVTGVVVSSPLGGLEEALEMGWEVAGAPLELVPSLLVARLRTTGEDGPRATTDFGPPVI